MRADPVPAWKPLIGGCNNSQCADVSCLLNAKAAPGPAAPGEQGGILDTTSSDPQGDDVRDILLAAGVPEAAGWSKEYISK